MDINFGLLENEPVSLILNSENTEIHAAWCFFPFLTIHFYLYLLYLQL